MTILSEAGVRKIIRKKMINEIGFRGVDPKAGSIDNIECDLSGIDQKTLAVKFAKYFIYNPKIERKVGDETEIYTKRNLLPFITSLNDKSDAEFEKKIKQKISSDPGSIDKYIEALEFAMKMAFGPFANLYCTLIVSALGTGYTSHALDAEKNETSNIEEILIKAFKEVEKLFNREHGLDSRFRFSKQAACILFPETLKALKAAGGRGHDRNSRSTYRSEEVQVIRFYTAASVSGSKPQEIFSVIERTFFSSVSNREKILAPLKAVIRRIDNSNDNGSAMMTVIQLVLDDAQNNLKP